MDIRGEITFGAIFFVFVSFFFKKGKGKVELKGGGRMV